MWTCRRYIKHNCLNDCYWHNLICCFVNNLQAFISGLIYLFTDGCVAFLKKQAASLGLPLKVYSIVPGKPIVVLTWEGSEPNLPSVLLNSHMDVVPVFPVSTGHMWTVTILVKIKGVITGICPSELKELLILLCVLEFAVSIF